MHKAIYIIASFAMGAAAGSLVTWQITNKKYQKIAQEEIASVKETFKKFNIEVSADDKDLEPQNVEESYGPEVTVNMMEHAKKIAEKYNTASKKQDDPYYVITPEEFGEIDEYETVTLSYFGDEELADDEGNIVDIAETIGFDALQHIGDYDEGAVYVRNDATKTDYEVLQESKTYAEVFGK